MRIAFSSARFTLGNFPQGTCLHCREREAGTTTYQNFLIDVVHGPADDKYECICHGGVNRKIFNG